MLVTVVATLAHAGLLLWAAVRVKVRRWRWLFIGMVVSLAFLLPMYCGGLHFSSTPAQFMGLLISVWLVGLVLTDHLQGLRYPWTHWLGVGLYLVYVALNTAYWVRYTLLDSNTFF